MKLGILASGDLGKNILEKIVLNLNTFFVLTDSNSIGIIQLCEKYRIPFFAGNPRNGRGYGFIKEFDVDVIISINYIFLIESDIIQHPNKIAFNIHGSLLPKYRGRTPHIWSIINNEKETGISAHLIDEGCDTGPILKQIVIPINPNETGNDILKKFKSKYYGLIQNVISQIEKGNLDPKPQDESKATYFGVRRPIDGRIDWNWQKERIINWVRAQAFPYPGAYSTLDNEKIIIDRIQQDSRGFNSEIENGTILDINPKIIVKTPNGALRINKIRNNITFKIGDILK